MTPIPVRDKKKKSHFTVLQLVIRRKARESRDGYSVGDKIKSTATLRRESRLPVCTIAASVALTKGSRSD